MKKYLLALSAAAMLLAACDKADQPAEASQASAPAPAAAGGYAPGETYFKLPNAAGGEVDLASYAGKPVLVMFYTETCPYCRKAAPLIGKVHSVYGTRGLGVVGICVQDSAQAALNFASDFGLKFPMAYRGKDVSRKYRTQGVPYIYLLDKGHKIYDVWEGYDPQYDGSVLKGVETVLAAG